MDNIKVIYKNDKRNIKLFFLYIDEDNILYSIKEKEEEIIDGKIKSERQLYLIKENQYNLDKRHKLISLCYFNISINNSQIDEFTKNNVKNDIKYLKNLEAISDIELEPSLDIFENINSIYYIYKILLCNNNTKRIKINNNKTRRK